MTKLLALSVLALSFTACKKSEKKPDTTPAPAGSAAPATPGGSAAPAGSAQAPTATAGEPALKGCDFITAAEASTILGGKVKIEAGETDCTMSAEDPATMIGFSAASTDIKDSDLIASMRDMYKADAKDIEVGGAKGIIAAAQQTTLAVTKNGKTAMVTLMYMNPDAAKGADTKAKALVEKLVPRL